MQSIIYLLIGINLSITIANTVAPIATTSISWDNYQNNTIEKTLGLVLNTRQIKITKLLESNSINVVIQVEKDPHFYDVYLKKIEAMLLVKKALPMFGGDSRNSIIITSMMDRIEKMVKKIIIQIFSISQHSADSANPLASTTCQAILDPIPASQVESVYLDVEEYAHNLNDSITLDNLPHHVHNVMYWLHHTERAINILLEQTSGRMELLETLSSHQVSDSLPTLLQLQPCHDNINIEEITVKICYNTNIGLSCMVELEVQKDTETLSQFTLINYKGVQLKLWEKDDILVKNSDGHFFILRCIINDKFPTLMDEFEDCESIVYDNACTENLEQKENIDKAIQNCNFTYATSHNIINFQDGVLIQDSVIWIKELHPVSKAQISVIKPKTPVVIRSNALISIFHNTQMVIRPEKQHHSRSINYTFLTDSQLEQMEAAAFRMHMKEDINRGDMVDFLMGLMLLVLTPGGLYSIYQCFQTGIIFKNCCKTKKRTIGRANYERNRRILQNPMFQPTVLNRAKPNPV
jgi:hypothetical protein